MTERFRHRAFAPATTLAFALWAALSAPGCKPKEGASCKQEGYELCVGGTEALACHDGVQVPLHCRGKAGCDKRGENGVCDQSLAEAGDTCNLESDLACSLDGRVMLACRGRRWAAAQTCAGERGCAVTQGRVSCDNTTAAVTDPCLDEDDYACTADRTAALVCRGGKFAVAALCKGPKACRVIGGRELTDGVPRMHVACDDSVAALGDPCEPEGHYACAVGGRFILRCKDRRFAQDDGCKDREICQVKVDQVGCYAP